MITGPQMRAARALLGDTIPLKDGVRQWANMGALVAALFRGDLDLLARALDDHVAEPRRASLVPGFRDVQRAAKEAGALGCSLSGSGPSIFAICRTRAEAEAVGAAMHAAFAHVTDVSADLWVSAVASQGARLVSR